MFTPFADDDYLNAAALNAKLRQIDEASGYPTGAILPYSGSAAPVGWLVCDGSEVSRTTYAALFAIIGTVWGAGDGSATFKLPDGRGRALIGAGTGTGLTARALGQAVGAETHQLTIDQMPAHTHIIPRTPATKNGSAVTPVTQGSQEVTGSSGDDGAHNNMQPSAVLNYLIKT